MSGHSKWATIKHKKGLKDAKRGALFTKLARNITVAASEGGGDPDMNFSLRLAIDKAKQANMPKDNIERSIKKGTGEIQGEVLRKVSYEAYSATGIAMIIDCTTDNTNRTISEITNLVESSGGKIADVGSVAWQFEEKGLIVIAPEKLKKTEKFGKEDEYVPVEMDDMTLSLMDIEGIQDIKTEVGYIEVITDKTELKNVSDQISQFGYKIETSELVKIAKDSVPVLVEDRRNLEKVVENMENHDDVDAVWINAD